MVNFVNLTMRIEHLHIQNLPLLLVTHQLKYHRLSLLLTRQFTAMVSPNFGSTQITTLSEVIAPFFGNF